MVRLHRRSGAAQSSADLHQTSAVVGHDTIRAAFAYSRELVVEHRARDVREFYGEQSAEPAAFLTIVEFDQVDAIDCGKKYPGLVANVKFAQQMARRMIRDGVLETRPDVLDLEDIDEELRELEHPGTKRFDPLEHRRIVGKQLAVENFDHACA